MARSATEVEHDFSVLCTDRHEIDIPEVLIIPPPDIGARFGGGCKILMQRHIISRPVLGDRSVGIARVIDLQLLSFAFVRSDQQRT